MRTTVSYTVKNDSGMNLYMALLDRSASLGSCSQAGEVRGALPRLDVSGRQFGSVPATAAGSPPPAFVPAGARVSGTSVLEDCSAPNPGSPTAPLAMTLLLRRYNAERLVTYPVSVDAPIRQVRPQY